METKTPLLRAVMSLVGFDRAVQRLEYPWVSHDAGRANSSRPRQRNDCTVRALAIARSMSYDDAYDLLKDAGRKCSRGFHFGDWVEAQPWAKKISFPAIKGQRRMNPARFVVDFPEGRYILRVAKHVFAVVDGVAYDTFENAPDRCVYCAWKIE